MIDNGGTIEYNKRLLWVYAPDYERFGAIEEIVRIPNRIDGLDHEDEYFWERDEQCSGFKVGPNC